MKNLLKRCIIPLLLLTLLLSACGKSEAAQNVDALIGAIGQVTLDSGDAIAAARAALDALEEKDRAQVEGTEILDSAQSTYDELVLADKAATVMAAIDAIGTVTLDSEPAITAARSTYDRAEAAVQAKVTNLSALEQAETGYAQLVLDQKVAVVEDAIAAIGQVTLDSGDAINRAWDAYNAAEPEVRDAVGTLAVLRSAEETLADLQADQQAGLVIDAINAIGTVTAQSGDAIAAARDAYRALPSSVRSRVTNLEVLEQAEQALKDVRLAAAEATLRGLWKKEDKVERVTYYYPSTIPHGSEFWYYDDRSFVLPYLRRDGDRMSMYVIYCFVARDWVFFEDITVVADNERFTDHFNYFDVDRDTSGSLVCENAQSSATSQYMLNMLHAIAGSRETIVRFEGDSYYRDITISAADKAAIQSVLTAYEAFQAL